MVISHWDVHNASPPLTNLLEFRTGAPERVQSSKCSER